MRRLAASSAGGAPVRMAFIADPAPGWIDAEELLGRDQPKQALFAAVSGVGNRPADYICAEWMLESWARAIADLAGSTVVLDRRLPDLTPENLRVAPYKGMVGSIAVRTGAMAALDTDIRATADGVVAVSGWTGLADLMRQGLADLLKPMIEWVDDRYLRPAKTLWRAAGDCLAQSLVRSGEAFGERDFALELTEHLMAPDDRLSVSVDRDTDETGEPFHLRTTCCLAYRTPEGGLCRSCPIARPIGR